MLKIVFHIQQAIRKSTTLLTDYFVSWQLFVSALNFERVYKEENGDGLQDELNNLFQSNLAKIKHPLSFFIKLLSSNYYYSLNTEKKLNFVLNLAHIFEGIVGNNKSILNLQILSSCYQSSIILILDTYKKQSLVDPTQYILSLSGAFKNTLLLAELGCDPMQNIRISEACLIDIIELYRQQEEILKQEEISVLALNAVANLGVIYYTKSRIGIEPVKNLHLAISTLSHTRDEFRRIECLDGLATSLKGLGQAHDTLATYGIDPWINIQEAINAYKGAIDIEQKLGLEKELALTLVSLTHAYLISADMGTDPIFDIQNAIDTAEKSLTIYNKLKLLRDSIRTLTKLGDSYLHLSNLNVDPDFNTRLAVNAYNNALDAAYRTNEDKFLLVHILINLSSTYILRAKYFNDPLKNYQKAIKSAMEAVEICRERDGKVDLVEALFNFGTILYKKGFLLRLHLGMDNSAYLQQAIGVMNEAFELQKEIGSSKYTSEILTFLGYAYQELAIQGIDSENNLHNAIQSYRQAFKDLDIILVPYKCFNPALDLGNLGFFTSKPDIAIEGYTNAVIAVENVRGKSLDPIRREEILSQSIGIYANLIQVYIDLGEYDKALEYADRSKTRNLVELLVTRNLYPQGDISEVVITRLDELRNAIAIAECEMNQVGRDSFRFMMYDTAFGYGRDAAILRHKSENTAHDRLLQLKQELNALIETEIKGKDTVFCLFQTVQPFTFTELRDTLPNDSTAILSWYIAGNKLVAFLITHNSTQPTCHSYPDSTVEELAKVTNAYLESYGSNKTTWRSELPDLLQQIAIILDIDHLLTQIFQILPICDELVIVPHRFLHILPLHILPVSQFPLIEHLSENSWVCLLDCFQRGIRFAPSLQILNLTQQRQKSDFSNFFAIQNPTLDLPFADIEVNIVRSLFTPQDFVLAREEATEAALYSYTERLKHSHCLHFSCHGYFNFQQPGRSALKLADQETDGLTLLDIFQLNLQQSSLTVLSACETGFTSFYSLSDEYVGLPSGFLFAGSPTVISSLWAVNDLSTSLLMMRFYENKKQRVESATALKEAQNWLRILSVEQFEHELERINPYLESTLKRLRPGQRLLIQESIKAIKQRQPCPFANPYYWAGFTVIGA